VAAVDAQASDFHVRHKPNESVYVAWGKVVFTDGRMLRVNERLTTRPDRALHSDRAPDTSYARKFAFREPAGTTLIEIADEKWNGLHFHNWDPTSCCAPVGGDVHVYIRDKSDLVRDQHVTFVDVVKILDRVYYGDGSTQFCRQFAQFGLATSTER
jgi:hypothetical protein